MFIWAHRGASGEFPENSLLAFEQAIVQGADGIELDVFQVEDELYITHDRYLPKSVGDDLLVHEQKKSQLDSIVLSQQQRIPTLRDVLSAIKGRVTVNIEIKYLRDIDILLNLLTEAETRLGFSAEQLLVSSFDHYVMIDFSRVASRFPIGVLTASSGLYLQPLIKELQPYSVHFDVNCLCQKDIDQIKASGAKCYVYTVDRGKDLRKMTEYGVDGVFTNFPQRSRILLSNLKSS